ncbi:MAG TPA: bifunctional DNA-formamidopyrimidine glycosylase/DNA-(apurinic or apyrimidinic site) lyase [Ktedonobacterales bacterium]|nr:bifunctional DNA-formamidopyrimidine glycosylase/DNA-(apurinic or apyrimidinic site) lyase [Ktedonobacterales bacterium]
MPELPEVEYVARQLRETPPGRRIIAVETRWERSIQGMAPVQFAVEVSGRVVTAVSRRAKYLLLTLDDGQLLIIHRRMSGNLLLSAAGAPEPLYARVIFTLDDARHLTYTDPRKFGRIALASPDALPATFAALGPEPLEDDFTPAVLAARLAGRMGAIKAVLLDQRVVAGLGNIYADEALFRAGVHPLRSAASLTPEETARLHAGIQGALTTGIMHGGTTFGRHRDIYDEAGVNLEHVEVYRRTGQPCVRCGAPIERIVVTQRSTHFCPQCQPPRPEPSRGATRRGG